MLLSNMGLLATAPGGVAKLRELILTLAVQGKLVPQDPADEPAGVLLQKIRAEKERLIAEGKIKRDKLLADVAEDEKPFELPQGWEWARFPELGQFGRGKSKHRPRNDPALFNPPIYPVIQTGEVARAKGVIQEYHSKYSEVGLAQSRLWPKGTLCITIAANIADAAILGFDACFPDSVVGFVPAKAIGEASYFLAFMETARTQLIAFAPATAQKNINLEILESVLIPIPPLAEMTRIVTRVEALMRLCDALEAKGQLEAAQHAQLVSTLLGTLTASTTPEELAANWQRVAQHFDLLLDRPEAIDALEQTLLQLAVRGLLVPQDPTDEPASALLQKIRAEKDRLIATGQIKRDKPLPPITDEEKPFELPVGWEWVRLADIADNRLGKMLDKAKNSGKRYPYLRNTNVQWHRIDLDDIKEISLEASELAEFRLVPGDLLICEGGYPGRCAIWRDSDREMYFQKALHRVRPRGGIAVELIAIALESDSRAGNLNKHFTGATIKHFVGQALDRYVFALPPLAEQSRIVTRVTALRRLCADLRQRLAERQSVQARLAEALVDSMTA